MTQQVVDVLLSSGWRIFSREPQHVWIEHPINDAAFRVPLDWHSATYRKEMDSFLMELRRSFTFGEIARQAHKSILKLQRPGQGGMPFGEMLIDGQRVTNPAEQATLARIRALHADGATLQRILDTLTAEGHQTRTGAKWHRMVISRLLRRMDLEPNGHV